MSFPCALVTPSFETLCGDLLASIPRLTLVAYIPLHIQRMHLCEHLDVQSTHECLNE
jgi:hypothetical protein